MSRGVLGRVRDAVRPERSRRAAVARQLAGQAGTCAAFGSVLYAELLHEAARDVEAGGPCWTVLAERRGYARGADDALALQLMSAVHRLVLEGRAPELAAHYPSAGGDAPPGDAWGPFRATVAAHADELRLAVRAHAVQTNEVGRSAVLVAGFLQVAETTGLPLRLLEVGASAGLNLRWDHYRYEAGGRTWGDPESPVRLGREVAEGNPLPPEAVPWADAVARRRGCDVAPIDPTTDDGRLQLLSYVWPDMRERLDLLRGALEVAARVPADVEALDGVSFVERELADPTTGMATVVFHSLVTQFFSAADRERFEATLRRAGDAATSEAPLAWLRLEWGADARRDGTELRLTLWPGGDDRLLATASPHGREIRFLGS